MCSTRFRLAILASAVVLGIGLAAPGALAAPVGSSASGAVAYLSAPGGGGGHGGDGGHGHGGWGGDGWHGNHWPGNNHHGDYWYQCRNYHGPHHHGSWWWNHCRNWNWH